MFTFGMEYGMERRWSGVTFKIYKHRCSLIENVNFVNQKNVWLLEPKIYAAN